jgi:hypothetical protein
MEERSGRGAGHIRQLRVDPKRPATDETQSRSSNERVQLGMKSGSIGGYWDEVGRKPPKHARDIDVSLRAAHEQFAMVRNLNRRIEFRGVVSRLGVLDLELRPFGGWIESQRRFGMEPVLCRNGREQRLFHHAQVEFGAYVGRVRVDTKPRFRACDRRLRTSRRVRQNEVERSVGRTQTQRDAIAWSGRRRLVGCKLERKSIQFRLLSDVSVIRSNEDQPDLVDGKLSNRRRGLEKLGGEM